MNQENSSTLYRNNLHIIFEFMLIAALSHEYISDTNFQQQQS